MLQIILQLLISLNSLQAQPPTQMLSPYVVGDTLHIEGRIESHIYDYLSYAGDNLKHIKNVRLNSFGGNHNWALLIAKKIFEEKWNTQLIKGDICASACVYLFGVGKIRTAHPSTWFGIHGARMGLGYLVEFEGKCIKKKTLVMSKDCIDLQKKNYDLNLEATLEAFHLIEKAGVSQNLLTTYFSFDDDPMWFEKLNFLKKPDWVLPSIDAIQYNLVTQISN